MAGCQCNYGILQSCALIRGFVALISLTKVARLVSLFQFSIVILNRLSALKSLCLTHCFAAAREIMTKNCPSSVGLTSKLQYLIYTDASELC